MAGIADTIVAGIVIIITITITTAADKRGVSAQIRHRPVSSGPVAVSAMKPADLNARYDVHRNLQELIMIRWIGVAVVAGVVALAAPASATSAAPAKPQTAAQQRHAGKATDFSAQRHYRRYHRYHYHYGYRPYERPYYQPYYRPYDPYYYGRPSYYQPYPYVSPAPFSFGFGFGPFW